MSPDRKHASFIYGGASECMRVYYIKNHLHFDMQIIVLKELNQKLHLWLSSLTQKISEKTAGINLSIMVINKLRDGKSVEEIAVETGEEVNIIEAIRKSLGLD